MLDRGRVEEQRRAGSEDRGERVKLTVAKTPNLMTRARARPTSVVSQADIDEAELEEIKKFVLIKF